MCSTICYLSQLGRQLIVRWFRLVQKCWKTCWYIQFVLVATIGNLCVQFM